MAARPAASSSAGKSKTSSSSKQTAPFKADPTTIIYDSAILAGIHPITIGAHSVIHPRAAVYSYEGPVTIGEYCIVCEKSTVGIPPTGEKKEVSVSEATAGSAYEMNIGSHVSIEPYAQVQASLVEDGCSFDVYSVAERGARLGKRCHVGARCTIRGDDSVKDNAVVFWLDQDQKRRYNNTGVFELEKANQEKHCNVLRQLWQASRKGKG